MIDGTAPDQVGTTNWRSVIRHSPTSWKVAAFVAALGWAVHISQSTTRSVNGVVTDCDGFDAGPFLVGGLVLALTAGGLRSKRLDGSARWAVAGVLLAAGAAYLIAGLIDPAGSAC